MSAPARYATTPTPGAKHETETVEKMARLLGTPLMEWQKQVARIATERRADGKGWRYPTIVLTVPRQSGKTTLMRAIMAQRTLRYPRFQAFYTAQSGKDARERWKDLVDVAEIKFPHLINVKRGAGAECMEWKNGRGQVRTFAPTRTALHGYTPELVMLDEAFAYDEDLGAALMAAIVPAQATLSERQLWIVSTAGDADSTWLKEWVDRGREATLDPMSSIAYFEWSAADDLNLADPETYPLFHPAVGETQTVETIAQARENMDLLEFERAFGNRWQTTRTALINREDIEATTNHLQTSPDNPADLALAYDIAIDRSWATIWASWTDNDGIHLRPYMSQQGTWWIVDAITNARDTLGITRIGADDGGATRTITKLLENQGIEVTTLTARDFANATGDFIDAIATRRIDHNGDPSFIQALEQATTRRLSESEAWSRRDSTGSIWEVIAATVALRLVTHTIKQPAPMIVT